MNVTPLFLKLQEERRKFVVVQGGGDASKTVSILQRMAQKRILYRGSIGTITGRTVPMVVDGPLRAFNRYVLTDPKTGQPTWVRKHIKKYNDTKREFTFFNGSILEFNSYPDEDSAQGSERDDLFENECNHDTYAIFWQLQRKTRGQCFLDYNPTSPFWVHDKMLPTVNGEKNDRQDKIFKDKVAFYRVWHQHNPYLTQEEHDNYENISDPELFRVYSRGLTGKIRGLVFGHMKRSGSTQLPEDCHRYFFTIDYGYTNDPTAILKCGAKGRQRFSKQLSYRPGIGASEIKQIILDAGWKSGMAIYSEADPNMINQLRLLGLPVEPAIKGPGSIIAGIGKVREYECFYTDDSLDFEKEISVYKFIEAEDIVTGRTITTNQPIDAWNHCCDSFRMGVYTDSFKFRNAA